MKFYSFFVLSSDFGCIQEKIITIYLLHNWHSTLNLILKWVKKSWKLFIISRVIQNLKKPWNFSVFRNIFVNNILKHFVLGLLNAEFCYLPCYSRKKIHFLGIL